MPGSAADPLALDELALPSASSTATYELVTTDSVTVHRFEPSRGQRSELRAPEAGKVTLELAGMRIAVELP